MLSWSCSRMGHLVDALEYGYRCWGSRTGRGDEVFQQVVLALIIEPVSLRALEKPVPARHRTGP
jgi:hypothetical protein